MTREWKPGDVAMVKRGPSWTGRAIRTFTGWVDQSGDPDDHAALFDVTDARPLAVIDPEDGEQVERLMTHYAGSPLMDDEVPDMQRALREFADPKPPKPEEPTVFAAVVLDADDVQWSRRADGHWNSATGDIRRWDEFSAVHVLSEGVQP